MVPSHLLLAGSLRSNAGPHSGGNVSVMRTVMYLWFTKMTSMNIFFFFCHFLNALLLSCFFPPLLFPPPPLSLIAPAVSPSRGCLFWKATVCVTAMIFLCAKPTGDKSQPRFPQKASPCLWQLPRQSRALLLLRAQPHRTLMWMGMGQAQQSTPEDLVPAEHAYTSGTELLESSHCCTKLMFSHCQDNIL